jgi:YidC/Oxa1 family membrane protein insertase
MDILYQLLIYPIIFFLNYIFIVLVEIVGGYGWAIVLLSLFVKLLLFPVSIYADRLKKKELATQKKMRPQVAALKKKYKGENQYVKLRELYKEFHYHPVYSLKTSLGLFIQIPFFVAAFLYFGKHKGLDGISFGVIDNLAQPDGILSLGSFSINVLPILMTLISFGATYLYSRRYEGYQAYQLYTVAVLFLLLLYREPASLLVYWTTNNIFSFIETFLNRPFFQEV